MVSEQNITRARTLLRITYGAAACIVGIDKFIFYIVDWNKYLWHGWFSYLPLTVTQFWLAVGIIETIAGLLVLNPKTTRLGAYLVAGWFGVVIINLFLTKTWLDIILRDAVMAAGSLALGLLS